ncbi:zinc-ribbon domain-containing protein [Lentiprolixibacter aurantiacus]|uniref:Zinc-ribbon domain-containing protein n=1 Tax=Lentiprolixibacter aurantiacus TaxID=2993939 RepID=A0AAE3ML14_9FLAO|nr:zinc-ribbon domain-containing protein [Lentiprolixibacter aurantiacus]MCX2719153.1 zinc-ribbon domain-containing protein [Lentiprolixibacter aurantiacus]
MILFFGTRPGKTRTAALTGVSCPHCGNKGQLTASSTPNFIHIFWIPVYRLGTSLVAECSHCKRGFYKEDFSSEMKRAVEEQLR